MRAQPVDGGNSVHTSHPALSACCAMDSQRVQARGTQTVWTSNRVAQRKAASGHAGSSGSSGSSASVWASQSPSAKPRAQEPVSSAPPSHPSVPAHLGSSTSQYARQPQVKAPPRSTGMRKRDESQQLGAVIDPMSLIASPSRGIQGTETATLGTAADQDLTHPTTQDKYRQFLSRRLSEHCDKFPLPLSRYTPPLLQSKAGDSDDDDLLQQAKTSLEEILLQGRKLREGITASRRADAFAIETYHLVLLLAIVTLNTAQVSATIHRLVFDLYTQVPLPMDSRVSASPTLLTDFAKLPGSQITHLDLFADTQKAREHLASLLLLSHTCLAGGSVALGDNFPELEARIADSLGHERGQAWQSTHIQLASAVDLAVRQMDIPAIRRLMLGKYRHSSGRILAKPTLWQRTILSQLLPRLRSAAWAQLRKVYLTLPLSDLEGCNKGVAWLHRTLLIDSELEDLSEVRTDRCNRGAIPNSWDEDSGGDARGSSSNSRLATVFRLQGLPPAAPGKEQDRSVDIDSELLPWIGRITTNTTTKHQTIKIR